jgi:hypothetical protein
MKKFCVIHIFIASLLATQVLAGTLTINGDLIVTTNLTAQSITLGGVTLTNWASGRSALQFNGATNYVGVVAFTNNATSTRTVEWWAKSAGTGNGFYLGSWQNSVSQHNFLCVNNVSAGEWYVQTGSGTVYVSPVPTEASDGKWHHYALVESNSTVTVFIDGNSRTNGAASLSMGGVADFEIGDIDSGGSGPAYNGTVDEVRISNVARYTAKFIPVYYPVADLATVGLWRFDEGGGTNTADVTGNHNGTLLGSPLPTWVGGR